MAACAKVLSRNYTVWVAWLSKGDGRKGIIPVYIYQHIEQYETGLIIDSCTLRALHLQEIYKVIRPLPG
jgi:hypothetical protein